MSINKRTLFLNRHLWMDNVPFFGVFTSRIIKILNIRGLNHD